MEVIVLLDHRIGVANVFSEGFIHNGKELSEGINLNSTVQISENLKCPLILLKACKILLLYAA
jgi:hypothetical protein